MDSHCYLCYRDRWMFHMSGTAQVAIHGATSHPKTTFDLNEQNRLHILIHSGKSRQRALIRHPLGVGLNFLFLHHLTCA